MKAFCFLLLVSILHIANANEYSIEKALGSENLALRNLGYSTNLVNCQKFFNEWLPKFSTYLEANPEDARAYYFRGKLSMLKPTCWRRSHEDFMSLGRDDFLKSQLMKDSVASTNADWNLALDYSADPTNDTRLSWSDLIYMFSPFLDPIVVEKKAKLQIEIATPADLGDGSDHPVDKSTYLLKQYEQIADQYNYSDDRKNVIRILKELGGISSEGSRKANELLPLYEGAWRKRDDRAALQEKEGLLKEDETSKNNKLEADTVPVDEDKTSGKATQPNVRAPTGTNAFEKALGPAVTASPGRSTADPCRLG